MGQMWYNKNAGVSGEWSLTRDPTKPFRPQIWSVLRILLYIDILLFFASRR